MNCATCWLLGVNSVVGSPSNESDCLLMAFAAFPLPNLQQEAVVTHPLNSFAAGTHQYNLKVQFYWCASTCIHPNRLLKSYVVLRQYLPFQASRWQYYHEQVEHHPVLWFTSSCSWYVPDMFPVHICCI